MTQTQERKLADLARYGTRYEVVLEHGGRSYLVAYTIRKSFQGLLAKMRESGPSILRLTEMPEDARASRYGAELAFSNGWVIRFSGRTQREAITAGELVSVNAALVARDATPAEAVAILAELHRVTSATPGPLADVPFSLTAPVGTGGGKQDSLF